jgi:hypothetical protein
MGQPAIPDVVTKTVHSLREAKETDIGLLNVLSRTILTVNSAATATADALAEIEKLASERAEELKNGSANYD